MATKTAEKPVETTVPPLAPEASPPATIKKAEAWERFRDDLEARANEIGSQLPSTISRDRFLNASIAAVKANPDILLATPRSLFSALTKAASDGLLPDGREGIITVYEQKVRGSNPERKEWVAQWNPMFYGIRKRAREIDGIIIDAQVVMEGDEFDYELGDRPFIKHKPKVRAEKVDASKGVAVYAIFRAADEHILHREVMFKPDVFDVMNQSRAKGSLMWTTFWTEGWRKTVGRRGAKSVPMSPSLEQVIQRDDENFSFDRAPVAIGRQQQQALPEPDEPPKPGQAKAEADQSDLPEVDEPPRPGEKVAQPVLHNSDHPEGAENEVRTPDGLLADLAWWLDNAADEAGINEVWSELDVESEFSSDPARMGKAIDLKIAAVQRVEQKAGAKVLGARTDEEQAAIDKQVDDLFPGARGA